MASEILDVAVIGAGPYGLSVAAHSLAHGRATRAFGTPMGFWRNHMPQGMHLKSEGFATGVYEPSGKFTLASYCYENGIPYADIGLPVAIETYIAYGLEFQRRYVKELDPNHVSEVSREGGRFRIVTSAGDTSLAKTVVIAAGLDRFAYVPEELTYLSSRYLTHSSAHSDLQAFAGQSVAIIGAGATAFDTAALLVAAGARPSIIARRRVIDYHNPPSEPRSLIEQLKSPRSGLGLGWRSKLSTDAPLLFRILPARTRIRVVKKHLGPAPCWFTRSAVQDRVPIHLGAIIEGARIAGDRIELTITSDKQRQAPAEFDHVIAATGYRTSLSKLTFIKPELLNTIATVVDTPILDRNFMSSADHLYFVGSTAANSFGPLLRFACGAQFASRRLSRHLAKVTS